MARADVSATVCAFRAGEGDGVTTVMVRGSGRKPGGTSGWSSVASIEPLGKLRSTPELAYVSTETFPACATTREYLPRLKPARGIGRSDIQRPTCSPCVRSVGGLLSRRGESTRFPVATSIHPAG